MTFTHPNVIERAKQALQCSIMEMLSTMKEEQAKSYFLLPYCAPIRTVSKSGNFTFCEEATEHSYWPIGVDDLPLEALVELESALGNYFETIDSKEERDAR